MEERKEMSAQAKVEERVNIAMQIPEEYYTVTVDQDKSKLKITLDAETTDMLADFEPNLWRESCVLNRFFKGSDIFGNIAYGVEFLLKLPEKDLLLRFTVSDADASRLAIEEESVKVDNYLTITPLTIPSNIVLELIITLPEGEKLIYAGTHEFPSRTMKQTTN